MSAANIKINDEILHIDHDLSYLRT